MSSTELIHNSVLHYLKNHFRPSIILGEKKTKYILTNAFRMSLGRSFDHTNYCVWLANNTPGYGVIAKSRKIIQYLVDKNRLRKHSRDTISIAQINLLPAKLDVNTQVLIIMNASHFNERKITRIARSWFSDRPMLMIG